MGARLAAFVAVHVADGQTVWYGPDSDVPAEHAALITNPGAWEGGVTPGGAGDDDWGMTHAALIALAAASNVEVDTRAKKSAIVAALVAAGVTQPDQES